MEKFGVHTVPKGVWPCVTVKVQLDFELTYIEYAVQHFSHYAKGPTPKKKKKKREKKAKKNRK